MKRVISLILAVGIAAGALLFGETGYKKFQWNYPIENVLDCITHQTPLNEAQKEYFAECLIVEELPILGMKTEVFYFSAGNYISGIAYFIPTSKVKSLKTNLRSKVTEVKVEGTQEKTYKNKLNENYPELNPEDYWRASFASDKCIFSIYIEAVGYDTLKQEKGKKNCTLSIYDYNDDTRVYIYENIIEGQTVVVYVPHEQDY